MEELKKNRTLLVEDLSGFLLNLDPKTEVRVSYDGGVCFGVNKLIVDQNILWLEYEAQ